MELIVSGVKHFEVGADLQRMAEEAANKLEESYVKLSSLRLVLNKQRNWHTADAVLNGKNISLVAKARSNDIRISINEVFEKLDRQMRRYIEKIKDISTKADQEAKDKIWTSAELADADEIEFELDDIE
ncbi:MAG: ribosome-associated translation inhibitor RaiA [Oligosphaeraceae bacterium]|nr:ribosome-associated translation inhibitor RaiA [Oligosphaeraceae bacterium]